MVRPFLPFFLPIFVFAKNYLEFFTSIFYRKMLVENSNQIFIVKNVTIQLREKAILRNILRARSIMLVKC